MPSIKLFKRMTALKRDNTVLENEIMILKEKLDDYYFMNQKLD
jgi:hypothetical protein